MARHSSLMAAAEEDHQTKREHTQPWVQVVHVLDAWQWTGVETVRALALGSWVVLGRSTCSMLDAYGCRDSRE